MKLSDLKSVVKASLREAFYTKRGINESLMGHQFNVEVNGEMFVGLISKNNNPKEKKYKITFFKKDDRAGPSSASVYWDLDEDDIEFIAKNRQLPDRFTQPYRKAAGASLVFERMLNEELFGIKMKVVYMGCEYDALISRNTIPGELPFRFTWFDSKGNDVTPLEHHDITEKDIGFILKYKRFPYKVIRKFGQWGAPEIVSISDKVTPSGRQLATAENLNEELFFLENSARELDLFIENKLPNGQVFTP